MSKVVTTAANVITSSLIAISNKYNINSLQILPPKILADLIKLLESSVINKQGLESVLDSLAQEAQRLSQDKNKDSLEEDPFGSSQVFSETQQTQSQLNPGEFYFPQLDIKKKVEDMGLIQVSDDSALKPIVDQVINQNQSQVEQYRSGKVQVLGFLVGQCMKLNKSGSPAKYSDLLKSAL